MKRFRYLLLTLLLLGGQIALLVHAADVAGHASGGHCEICLHSTPLDAGVTPAAIALPPVVRESESFAETSAPLIATCARSASARGPPATLSA